MTKFSYLLNINMEINNKKEMVKSVSFYLLSCPYLKLNLKFTG